MGAIEIFNDSQYITPETLEECFKPLKTTRYNYIDKVLCGNGFSTAFLRTAPKKKGNFNIMIAPNRAVVEQKERAYDNGEVSNLRIKFIYGKSVDRWNNIADTDIIACVYDSFYHAVSRVERFGSMVERVLIDEIHTTFLQSKFRKKLQELELLLNRLDSATQTIFVTATPNLYDEPTHRIINKYIPPIEINFSKSVINSLERAKELVEEGEKVIIASNSAKIIKEFKRRTNKKIGLLNANFMFGDTLLSRLAELAELQQDEKSNLIFMSSKAFEGHDIKENDWNVFFFEDRNQESTTFPFSNVIQAISRPRKGAKYVEYCKRDKKHKRALIKEKDIIAFIESSEKPNEAKLSKSDEMKKIRPFIFTTTDQETTRINIHFNRNYYNIMREIMDSDFDDDLSIYDDYLKTRNIKINKLESSGATNRFPRQKDDDKANYVAKNKELLKNRGILKTLKIDVTNLEGIKIEPYLNRLKKFKRFYAQIDDPNPDQEYRVNIATEFFNNEPYRNQIINDMTSEYRTIINNDDNLKKEDKRKKIKDFKKNIDENTYKLVLLFCNEKIKIPEQMTAHRDYNLVVTPRPSTLNVLGAQFRLYFTEYDISSCFARVLYALLGLGLPDDLYGENKKNKKSINVAINDIFYDPKRGTNKHDQKQNQRRRLTKLGFDEKVTEFILDKFFDSHKSEIFHFLSCHEKWIIEKLKEGIDPEEFNLFGMVRRHDSLLLISDCYKEIDLSDFEYLGQTGWFKPPRGGVKTGRNFELAQIYTP